MVNNITSSPGAAWWVKNPMKALKETEVRKKSIGTSFCHDLADLFRNISLHGYSHLLDSEFNLWEKLIWLAVHSTTLFTLIVVLSVTWEQFVAQYIVIHLHDPIYSVQNVPFPAVSICSNNRISHEAATAYAKELRQKDSKKRSVKYFLERISHFADMYYKNDVIAVDAEDFSDFQSFLDTYDTLENETFFDTGKIIRQLTPKCDDLIKKCMLAGMEIECFSRRAFQESLTVYGPCCTFNLENSYRHRTMKNRFAQSGLGLTVILNISHSDYLVSILKIDGYVVIVHAPDEFPDIASGASQEVFPARGEESFVSIRARIIDTASALRDFHPKTRKCYFDDEAPNPEFLFRKGYSFTNCITRCRIRSIMALCNCLPFYMPLHLVDSSRNIVYCTLQHISCLARYNYKWRNVLTQRKAIPGLEREMEEALYCPQCMPTCDDVQYRINLNSLPTDRFLASIDLKQLNLSSLKIDDTSVLRVYFGEPHAQYYRRLVDNTWFEALSTVGNFTSIFVGFSMVAILEIIFFIIKYIVIMSRNYSEKRKNEAENKVNDLPDNTEFYICP